MTQEAKGTTFCSEAIPETEHWIGMGWLEFFHEFRAAQPLAKLEFELCSPPGYFLGVGELRVVRVQPVPNCEDGSSVWRCLAGYQTYQKIAKVRPPKNPSPNLTPVMTAVAAQPSEQTGSGDEGPR